MTDQEKYQQYEPGKYEYLEVIPAKYDKRYLRLLEPHEYFYFLSFLDPEDDTYSKPIKAAIAYCLDEDQRRLFEMSYKYYADPLIQQWVEYYLTLEGGVKQMADSEIYHFHQFLIHTESHQPEVYERESAMQYLLQSQALVNRLSEAMFKVVMDDGERRAKEMAEASRKAQDAQAAMRRRAKEKLEKDPGLEKRREEWLSMYFVEYMAGYFVRHPISLMADALKSDLEYEVRTSYIRAHKSGLDRPSILLARYIASLDLIYAAKDKRSFYSQWAALNRLVYRHPIARYLRKSPKKIQKINPSGAANYAHPMDQGITALKPSIGPDVMNDFKDAQEIPMGADSEFQ